MKIILLGMLSMSLLACSSAPEAILSKSGGCSVGGAADGTSYSSEYEYVTRNSSKYEDMTIDAQRDFEKRIEGLSDSELRQFIHFEAKRQNYPMSNVKVYGGFFDYFMAAIRGGQNLYACASTGNLLGCAIQDIQGTIGLVTGMAEGNPALGGSGASNPSIEGFDNPQDPNMAMGGGDGFSNPGAVGAGGPPPSTDASFSGNIAAPDGGMNQAMGANQGLDDILGGNAADDRGTQIGPGMNSQDSQGVSSQGC